MRERVFEIELAEMGEPDFEVFKARTVKDYAEARIASGDWAAKDADRLAREAFDKILPNGLLTHQNDLWNIIASDQKCVIGSVWVQLRSRGTKQTGHILDIFVTESYRRMGVGRKAMKLVEDRLRVQQIDEITLNVFGYNTAAFELYKSLGFQVVELSMCKDITA